MQELHAITFSITAAAQRHCTVLFRFIFLLPIFIVALRMSTFKRKASKTIKLN